jgi:hypothetical protein
MNLLKNALIIFSLFMWITPVRGGSKITAKDINSVNTAVPFLTIAPDSRSAGMGDVGVATSPDVYSLHWNPAKYVFLDGPGSVALSYSPWLRQLVSDMNLLYLTGYKRIDKSQTVAASLRYFDMGSIDFYDDGGQPLLEGTPNEFAIDIAYSRKFSEKISAALAFRYIRSDISSGVASSGSRAKAGNSFAADIAMFYHKDFLMGGKVATWAWGADISNIGSKMTYSNEQEKTFIPINMRLGTALGVYFDDFNKLSLSVDLNKFLVPTPPYRDASGEIIKGKNPDVGIVQGIFQSFYDAPEGFSEEMREITYSFGLEYAYNEVFTLRTGYFYGSQKKGFRNYFSMGVGFQVNRIGLDFSYLVKTQNNPLGNTLRISLRVNFGQPAVKTRSDMQV